MTKYRIYCEETGHTISRVLANSENAALWTNPWGYAGIEYGTDESGPFMLSGGQHYRAEPLSAPVATGQHP